MELHSVHGESRILTESAQVSSSDEASYAQVDARFRASYYFGVAELALLGGHPQEAAKLLKHAAEADPSSGFLLREEGEAWEAADKDDLALACLQAALTLDSDDLELRQHLARLYLEGKHKDLAQKLFLKADGSDPDDPAYLRALIGIDVSTDDLAKSESRLRRLLAMPDAGTGADERELLALTLQRQERWTEAAKEFRALLKVDSTRSSAWARLAACEDAGGDSTAAMQALHDGLAAVPDSPLLQDQLAKAYYNSDRFKEAEAAFDELLKADPKDTQSLLYRGLSRLKQKRFSEAQDDFVALGQLEKDSPSQLYALGLSLLWQGKQADAEKAFQQVIVLNDQAVPAYTQLAFIYDKQGRTDKAVALLEQGHAADPKAPELSMLLAAGYMDQKDYSKAEGAYLDALAKGGSPSLFRFQLAVLYDKWDKFPKAEEALKALLADDPKNAQALNYLGYSWVERGGDLKEAEALIRRALDQDPGNAFYQDSLGWDLHKQGRDKEALKQLQEASDKVLKAAPDDDDPDADNAVVLDHLAAVRTALGQERAADEAKAVAQDMRTKAQARPKAADDPAKEPDL